MLNFIAVSALFRTVSALCFAVHINKRVHTFVRILSALKREKNRTFNSHLQIGNGHFN